MSVEYWLYPENPWSEEENAPQPLGPFQDILFSQEHVLNEDDQEIASLWDDNHWHIHKKFDVEEKVYPHIRIKIKQEEESKCCE